MKILIVEDDLIVLKPLAEFLSLEGHEVFSALSAEKAIAILSKSTFDIIFCDIILGGAKGTGVVHYLRQKQDNTPLIFVTALVSTKDRLTGLKMGATGYIEKPCSTDEIVKCIEGIEKHRAIANQWLKK